MLKLLWTVICIVFMGYLIREDLRKHSDLSKALWIPLIWIFLSGSRFVSQWVNFSASSQSPNVYLEGSPLDRLVFLVLIIAGVMILLKRNLAWGMLFSRNLWMWLFYIYSALSFLWSDYPFVSFKRWIKDVGNIIMALVILSEMRPYEAFVSVLRRFAYVVIPLSVLLCKYYPEMGKASMHRGTSFYTGVAMGKNGLGQICLLCGIYFFWRLFHGDNHEIKSGSNPSRMMSYFFLVMIAWLLQKADSATSLVCLLVVLAILLVSRMNLMLRYPQRIMSVGLVFLVLIGVIQILFNVKDVVLSALDRDPNLTTRVPMWNGLLDMQTDPLFGVGYDSFWLSSRLEYLWGEYGSLIQSHNGYLETYLNLGLAGLLFILAIIISGLVKTSRYLTIEYPYGMMRLALIVTAALYNWTEAAFNGVSNIWFVLIFCHMEVVQRQNFTKNDVGRAPVC